MASDQDLHCLPYIQQYGMFKGTFYQVAGYLDFKEAAQQAHKVETTSLNRHCFNVVCLLGGYTWYIFCHFLYGQKLFGFLFTIIYIKPFLKSGLF